MATTPEDGWFRRELDDDANRQAEAALVDVMHGRGRDTLAVDAQR